MKIAFVGPPAVGKDVVSEYLSRKYSIKHISSGDIIRKYILKNKLGKLDRKNLQITGNKLRKEFGGDVLVKMAIEESGISGDNSLILSGLRAIDEVETFKNLGGKVIAIIAPIEQRYSLAKKRGRIDENISFEEFKKIEDEENLGQDRESQNVSKVISMADMTVVNDGTLEELYEKCERVYESPSISSPTTQSQPCGPTTAE